MQTIKTFFEQKNLTFEQKKKDLVKWLTHPKLNPHNFIKLL